MIIKHETHSVRTDTVKVYSKVLFTRRDHKEKQPVPVTDRVTFQKHKFHTNIALISTIDTVKSDITSKSTYSFSRYFFK